MNVDDTKKQNVPTNLESSKSHSGDDVAPESLTTPVPSVTKRTSTTSHKASSRSQDHVPSPAASQEKASQREIPTPSKVSQSVDSSQKISDKNIDNGEVETKSEEVQEAEVKTKTEPVEQDAKIAAQPDQLNFESFDFDVESLPTANGAGKNDASVNQQTASATVTPQQKESVFLRLSNRIKVSSIELFAI